MSICLMTRFKNERHIMYEFINHYLEEGIDCFILIDDHSDDNYLELNKEWMNDLIKSKKIIIKKSCTCQQKEYNLYFKELTMFDWIIICDMDEFFFSVPPESTLKSLLNNKLSTYDYIRIPWKLFKHDCYHQPKSIINDNLYTHSINIDPTSPSKGYKSIVRSKVIKSINIHDCIVDKESKILKIECCHNNLIQNNHYRTQSEEYLRGVKEIRGAGGGNINKYKNFKKHKIQIYEKKCQLLANKKKNLIDKCLKKGQIKPKINSKSSFFLENQK